MIKQAAITWQGSVPCSSTFDDVYYSAVDGLAETRYVFHEGNRLRERLAQDTQFTIGELGFGTGLNFCATLELKRALGDTAPLNYISFEKYPLHKETIAKALMPWPELRPMASHLTDQLPIPVSGFHRLWFPEQNTRLTLVYGDARETIKDIACRVDAWFLDGFSPSKNPELWEQGLFEDLALCSKPGSTCATFSAASLVKARLRDVGFEVETRAGFGKKREMVCGYLPGISHEENTPPKNAAVIGAGVAGCSIAHALAVRGCDISIFDAASAPASAASGNPTALLMPHPSVDYGIRARLSDVAFQHAFRLLKHLPATVPHERCGALRIASADAIKNVLERWESFSFDQDFAKKLSAAEVRQMTGTSSTEDGIYYPGAGWLDPAAFCKTLIDAQSSRILFKGTSKINDLSLLKDFDCIIIATGVETNSFAESSWIPVHSIRGQLSFVKATPLSEQIPVALCHRGYITPARDGIHTIGATFDYDRSDTALSDAGHEALLERTQEAFPELVFPQPIGGRVSFRAQPPDKLPLAGKLPYATAVKDCFSTRRPKRALNDYPPEIWNQNVYLTAGHGSHGISTGPLLAEAVASEMFGEPSPIGQTLYESLNPGRFLLRTLRKGADR